MKEFNIKITDDEVYINGKLQYFSCLMDKENHEDDLNKKALVALADVMNYEPIFLFEEMAYRLDEMLDEVDDNDFGDEEDEEYDDDNDFIVDDEMIEIWLSALRGATGKHNMDELTAEEIRAEIEEVKCSIKNEEILIGVSEFAEGNIANFNAYLEILNEMLNNKEVH